MRKMPRRVLRQNGQGFVGRKEAHASSPCKIGENGARGALNGSCTLRTYFQKLGLKLGSLIGEGVPIRNPSMLS
jgi:hypothetical protein